MQLKQTMFPFTTSDFGRRWRWVVFSVVGFAALGFARRTMWQEVSNALPKKPDSQSLRQLSLETFQREEAVAHMEEHDMHIAKTDNISPPVKPILFVHFHKSGGTTICNIMARHQNVLDITDMTGEKRELNILLGRNCNTEIAEPRLNVERYHYLQTCRHLIPYTMDEFNVPFRRNNFLSIEVPMKEQMPCEGFRSFAVMRHPVERLISQMKAYHLDEKKVINIIEEKIPISSHSYTTGYPIVNSFVIRQLLGQERYMDVRPIDRSDFEEAKLIVDKFDAFVPLEYLGDSKVHDLLRKTIPEFNTEQTGIKVNAGMNWRDSEKNLAFSSEFLDLIASENLYDTMIYEYIIHKLGL